VTAEALNPALLIGRLATPLRDITPPAGGGPPPQTPYPALPGTPR
jgi:hypothetical protein